MKRYETPNYIFYYQENSTADRDILKIAQIQQFCYEYICSVLKTTPTFKIEYFLCETAEDVGRVYGDNEPCNGFASLPNKIYAVYNETTQCIGFHEDAHIISYTINRPNCPAIREGLAMYFDRKWWGIQNIDWVGYLLKIDKMISIDELLDSEVFFSYDCSITYPIMGAFTDWLISSYGIDKYLKFYRHDNTQGALALIYKKSVKDLSKSFIDYVSLFNLDEVLEQRIEKLISNI